MPENTTIKKTVSVEEILKTELIVNQALIDILLSKEIISEDELVAAIRNIRGDRKNKVDDLNNVVALKR